MTGPRKKATQPLRLTYILLYLGFLFAMNFMAFGQWIPLTSEKGLWFYSGAAALILGSLLVTPFFTSPANAISYLVAATIGVATFPASSAESNDALPRICTIALLVIMLAVCAFSIILLNSQNRFLHNASETCRQLADHLGSPRFLYALVIIYFLWEYHRSSPKELFFISISGLVIAAQQPLETFGASIQRIMDLWRPPSTLRVVGSIIAQQIPGLMLIRQESDEMLQPGLCLLITDKYASVRIGINLGYSGRDEGLLFRAIEIDVPVKARTRLAELNRTIPEGFVSILEGNELDSLREDVYFLKHQNTFVGIVSPDTSTERLYFEVTQERDLEQGRLVETLVGRTRVLYQILDGVTKEEIIQQKNTYGFARAEAAQVGIWDEQKRRFKPCNWIPRMNEAVFLKDKVDRQESKDAIGHFPSTDYFVEIKNLDEMVTHNTAILGILGVGKSMLAIELVERMIQGGIKIICIDLTNQYASELKDFYNIVQESECLAKIQEAGQQDSDAFAENPETGGSIQHLRRAIHTDLEQFLKQDDPRWVKIYNPAALSATKQQQEPRSYNDGRQWRRTAALWQVTPVEVTCVITETCLTLLQGEMSDKARACLVFEEAHSLIPERNFVTVEGDQRAASGTARAILQGRKFGLGCLLVTQRTANVSKTILNQCNTIFAMRTFDETGKDFLSSYISLKYSSKLSSLREREAVVFGRASSCENPVMIRLNDREDFLRLFRQPPRPI